MEPIIGMEHPFGYRNKAQFPVGRNKEGKLVAGFYAGRTHSIIDNRKCILGVPENEIILEKVLSFMEEYAIEPYNEETGTGLVRHILTRYGFRTKQIMVCLIINGKALPHKDKLTESLCQIPGMTSISLNVNMEKTNVILGREIISLWGQTYIEDYIGDVKYQISPFLLSGQPCTDREAVRTGPGICRPDRRRDCVGSVLRHRNYLSVPG